MVPHMHAIYFGRPLRPDYGTAPRCRRFVPPDSVDHWYMMRPMKRAFWILVLCIPAIACGQNPQAILASEAACGQGKGQVGTEVLTGPQSPPRIAPGKSLVYFVNPATWFYLKVSIAVDGHWITELGRRSHFAIAMQPGEHHLCARLKHWQRGGPYIGLMHINLEPAHTYYVLIWATSDDNPFDGGSATGAYVVPQLKALNADEGKFLVDATPALVRAGHGFAAVERSLAENPAAMKADMQGCGPASEQFNLRLRATPSPPHRPSPGNAAVYFIDLLAPARIGLDGKWLGALGWSAYAELEIAPGVHHLCERRQGQHKPLGSVALYGLNATAGNSYYFLMASGGTGFEEINPDEAQLLVATSKFGLDSQKLSRTAGRPRAKTRSAGGQQ